MNAIKIKNYRFYVHIKSQRRTFIFVKTDYLLSLSKNKVKFSHRIYYISYISYNIFETYFLKAEFSASYMKSGRAN